MKRHSNVVARAALLMALGVPAALAAQVTTPPPAAAPAPAPLKEGDVAPDFTLPVSTKDSIFKLPARLRDFRGQTVVLAFFFKVRTGG